jgi:prepilin-type N-terminal cleavage/methylation domain-containing protein
MRAGTERRLRGMTLIEIMISLVLLGIVSGVIMRVILRQQRFYQGVNQIMTQRGQLRQATSVVPVDLRSLSSVGADILAATDSSMDFMVNVGTGVVCNVIDGTQVALPPETLASG